MGKKSKANRKRVPVATATATATSTASVAASTASATTTTTTAVAVAAAAAAAAAERGTGTVALEEFPESTFFVKGESFRKKGNLSKAKKIFLQGIENGCVRCLNEYTLRILSDGLLTIAKTEVVTDFFRHNIHLHLVLPLLLESAIRGNDNSMSFISEAYAQARHETDYSSRFGHSQLALPLVRYWTKQLSENNPREDRTQMKQANKEFKKQHSSMCSVCKKEDSETVTLRKCDGCKFYYYCSKACQKTMWLEGQHAGMCCHLGILQKYHKPFAKKIRRDIAVHRIAPQDIPELQELRQRLGLSRPQADYQELVDAAQARRLDPVQLIVPRKDGTVQIGSFPRPI